MKNLNNPDTRKLIYDRLAKLSPGSKGRWGKMNVNQMLSHLTDAFRMQLGEIEVKDQGNFFTHTFIKWATLAGMSPPKNYPTFPPIDQVARGINPADFKQTSEILIETLRRTLELEKPIYHPLFGNLTVSQLGRINYIHMNHHLKEFGV